MRCTCQWAAPCLPWRLRRGLVPHGGVTCHLFLLLHPQDCLDLPSVGLCPTGHSSKRSSDLFASSYFFRFADPQPLPQWYGGAADFLPLFCCCVAHRFEAHFFSQTQPLFFCCLRKRNSQITSDLPPFLDVVCPCPPHLLSGTNYYNRPEYRHAKSSRTPRVGG